MFFINGLHETSNMNQIDLVWNSRLLKDSPAFGTRSAFPAHFWEWHKYVKILNISVKALPLGACDEMLWPQRKIREEKLLQTVGMS